MIIHLCNALLQYLRNSWPNLDTICTYWSIVKPTEMTPWMTTAMPLHPANTKMQPPARSAEFVFRIRRQIGYYVSPFNAGPKAFIKSFRLKTLTWLSNNAFEIMKISILTSIHQCLESSDLSCTNTIHLQQLTETCMRLTWNRTVLAKNMESNLQMLGCICWKEVEIQEVRIHLNRK